MKCLLNVGGAVVAGVERRVHTPSTRPPGYPLSLWYGGHALPSEEFRRRRAQELNDLVLRLPLQWL